MPDPARTTSSAHASRAAQELFASWIARMEAGETLDLDHLAAQAGTHAQACSELLARYRRLQGAFRSLAPEPEDLDAIGEELRQEYLQFARQDGVGFGEPQPLEERYELIARLGQGGMGVVFRVRDRLLQRDVAFKRLARGDRQSFLRFVDEARLVASLSHSGIVSVLDAGLDRSARPWFTMPLIRGVTLAKGIARMREGDPEWSREHLLSLLLQALEAVAYAHARGVVHRDLKPANIMVSDYGSVHVLDWGLARALSTAEALEDASQPAHQTRAGGRVGTPAYMSPEQARGERDALGPSSDVYSAGAILYEILAARSPYSEFGSQGDAITRAVIAGPPIPLRLAAPRSPSELISIVERAMQRNPTERYRDMAQLANDLRAYLEGRVVAAHASGPWPELRKWLGRNRALSVTLLALAASLVSASVFFAWTQRLQRNELTRLADAQVLEDLLAREARFAPARPHLWAEMDAWIASGENLLRNAPRHAADLDALLRDPQVEDNETRWRASALRQLTARLREFGDTRNGALARVRRLRERSAWIYHESMLRSEALWAQCTEELSTSTRAGLPKSLLPQFGLVPLGPDPISGLQEFVDLAAGTIPERAADGNLKLDARHGVVFVLVPGGEARIGSPGNFELPFAQHQRDLYARDHELPQRMVALDAFFLAKHELTQAQWERLTGRNPSYIPLERSSDTSRLLNPVDTVDWDECVDVLAAQGWRLPSETQWEHAARAGTSSLWWCGDDPVCLNGRVHASLDAARPASSVSILQALAHPYGFAHLLGNVAEWTSDPYVASHAGPFRKRDGEHEGEDSALRVTRGGSFLSGPSELRSSARDEQAASTRSATIGVRPARALESQP